MFRKLRERLTDAANAVMGTDDEQGVQALQSMGFSATDARMALANTNGNLDRAAELLLASGSIPSSSPPPPMPTYNNNHQTDTDSALNQALQESLQAANAEEARQLEAAQKESAAQKKPLPSAAASRAGQAAVLRAAAGAAPFTANKSTVCAHHPEVKVPKRLQNKPKEEQLLRCADRMKSFPRAVDTIYIALTSIQKDPDNDKFRKIDKTTAGYQRSLANAPGAEDMFKAMNFTSRGKDALVLSRDRVDPALLYLGISALETTQQTPEYKEGKQMLLFEKQLRSMFDSSDISEQDAIKRANYMSKCPSEPTGGRGALISVKIGSDREPFRRKYDGDDTLEDVLNWLGGVAPDIPDKLMTREWSLIDLNRYPIAPTDCEEDRNKTLQYLGLFPSGRLEIVPSSEAWQATKSLDVKAGSSRGLGAASH